MSTVPPATGKQAAKPAGQAPPDKDLRGLMPYLRRYPSGIVIGPAHCRADGIVGMSFLSRRRNDRHARWQRRPLRTLRADRQSARRAMNVEAQ